MLEFLAKKETKIAAVILAVIIMILTVVLVANQNNIKQTQKSLEHEAGTEFVLEAKDIFKAEDDILAEITIDTSKVDVNTVGAYEATATYKNKEYVIKVEVVDTTAPKAELTCRYIFTNNVAEADLSSMIGSILDASEYTTKLIRFERAENLKELDENALNRLIEQINTHATEEELLVIGTTDIPTDEGIYRAVLEVADAYGNASYEEVIVILDMTGAKVEDTPDKTVTVSKEKLSEEPEVDKSDYIIKDNVDGKIAAENITTELELRDEAKHEWLVHVSYVDRAGNESKADFLIIVKEESKAQTGNNASFGTGETSNPGSGTNNGGSSNQSGSTNQNSNDGSGNSGSSDKPVNNLDVSTWNPEDYDENEINPYQQKIIDAGYGNVVDWGDGTYSVLVHKDLTANGKNGREILEKYLAERDLEIVQSYAGIIDEENDWYVYDVEEVRELTKSTWDDEEIEWID